MELICPLCNGLYEEEINCTKCHKPMNDMGRISNFYDDYSTYLEMNITELIDGVPQNQCVHIYKCSCCKTDKRRVIDKIIK